MFEKKDVHHYFQEKKYLFWIYERAISNWNPLSNILLQMKQIR